MLIQEPTYTKGLSEGIVNSQIIGRTIRTDLAIRRHQTIAIRVEAINKRQ